MSLLASVQSTADAAPLTTAQIVVGLIACFIAVAVFFAPHFYDAWRAIRDMPQTPTDQERIR